MFLYLSRQRFVAFTSVLDKKVASWSTVFSTRSVHPLRFIRDNKIWRLVLSLIFFIILTSFVPYLSLIFPPKNHSHVPYKGKNQYGKCNGTLKISFYTVDWLHTSAVIAGHKKIWWLTLQFLFEKQIYIIVIHHTSFKLHQLSLIFSEETSLCPLNFPEI